MTPTSASEFEFLGTLRTGIERYFAAVDQWESAYFRYYRMPDASRQSGDLDGEGGADSENARSRSRRNFVAAACPGPLLQANWTARRLRGFPPGRRSAMRSAPSNAPIPPSAAAKPWLVMACVIELSVACREPEGTQPPVPNPGRSLLDRIFGLFF